MRCARRPRLIWVIGQTLDKDWTSSHSALIISGKLIPISWETLPWHLIWALLCHILEKGNQIDPLFSIFHKKKSSGSRKTPQDLMHLDLQEDVHFILWKTLKKGSVWFPFSRIWLVGAGTCLGSVSQEPGGPFSENDSGQAGGHQIKFNKRRIPLLNLRLRLLFVFAEIKFLCTLFQVKI